MHPSIHPSINHPSINQSIIHLSINPPINQSTNQSIMERQLLTLLLQVFNGITTDQYVSKFIDGNRTLLGALSPKATGDEVVRIHDSIIDLQQFGGPGAAAHC
jgi:hypothetical protein